MWTFQYFKTEEAFVFFSSFYEPTKRPPSAEYHKNTQNNWLTHYDIPGHHILINILLTLFKSFSPLLKFLLLFIYLFIYLGSFWLYTHLSFALAHVRLRESSRSYQWNRHGLAHRKCFIINFVFDVFHCCFGPAFS